MRKRESTSPPAPPMLPFVLPAEHIIDIIARRARGEHVDPRDYLPRYGPDLPRPSPRRGRAGQSAMPPPPDFTALRKPIGRTGRVRVLCGMPARCPGHLGELISAHGVDLDTMAYKAWASITRCANDGEPPLGDWILVHSAGYFWDGQMYGVLRDAEPSDRAAHQAAVPKGLQNADMVTHGGRGNVGRFPSPPCLIRCPKCKRVNVVPSPPH